MLAERLPSIAERLPSVDDVVSSFEAGRQRLSEVDPVSASRSALESARDAIPEGFPGHKKPSRWPLVTALIIGMTVVGFVLFMAPTFQRYMARAKSFRSAKAVGMPPTAAETNAPTDETNILAHTAISDPFSDLSMDEFPIQEPAR